MDAFRPVQIVFEQLYVELVQSEVVDQQTEAKNREDRRLELSRQMGNNPLDHPLQNS